MSLVKLYNTGSLIKIRISPPNVARRITKNKKSGGRNHAGWLYDGDIVLLLEEGVVQPTNNKKSRYKILHHNIIGYIVLMKEDEIML